MLSVSKHIVILVFTNLSSRQINLRIPLLLCAYVEDTSAFHVLSATATFV